MKRVYLATLEEHKAKNRAYVQAAGYKLTRSMSVAQEVWVIWPHGPMPEALEGVFNEAKRKHIPTVTFIGELTYPEVKQKKVDNETQRDSEQT